MQMIIKMQVTRKGGYVRKTLCFIFLDTSCMSMYYTYFT